jgi:hypothetical protein
MLNVNSSILQRECWKSILFKKYFFNYYAVGLSGECWQIYADNPGFRYVLFLLNFQQQIFSITMRKNKIILFTNKFLTDVLHQSKFSGEVEQKMDVIVCFRTTLTWYTWTILLWRFFSLVFRFDIEKFFAFYQFVDDWWSVVGTNRKILWQCATESIVNTPSTTLILPPLQRATHKLFF